MLNGIYVDVNVDSNIFKIRNGRNDVICEVTDLESALTLVNEIKELQNDIRNTFNRLVKATYFNGIYLDAIIEAINNNNPAPAKKILAEFGPKFSVNHTTPSQFLDLNEGSQKFLKGSILFNRGDILYCSENKVFYIICNKKEEDIILYSPDFEGEAHFSYEEVKEKFIPCYSVHQLWDFLENYLDNAIEIKSKEKTYEVYSCSSGNNLGVGDTKIDALWNSMVNILE